MQLNISKLFTFEQNINIPYYIIVKSFKCRHNNM